MPQAVLLEFACDKTNPIASWQTVIFLSDKIKFFLVRCCNVHCEACLVLLYSDWRMRNCRWEHKVFPFSPFAEISVSWAVCRDVERYAVSFFLSLFLWFFSLCLTPSLPPAPLSLSFISPIKRLKLNLWQSSCGNPGFQDSCMYSEFSLSSPSLSLSLCFLLLLSFSSGKMLVTAVKGTGVCKSGPIPSCVTENWWIMLIPQLKFVAVSIFSFKW